MLDLRGMFNCAFSYHFSNTVDDNSLHCLNKSQFKKMQAHADGVTGRRM